MRSSSSQPENTSAATPSSGFQQLVPSPTQIHYQSSKGQSNVFQLLARREVSSKTKYSTRGFRSRESMLCIESRGTKSESAKDTRQELFSWVEAKSLHHLSANYCLLQPPPRSTIAAAFSPDGKTLASTHGDHTVKIIDSQTGKCLKVLSGHRRTPWVVRFHPFYPELLASGSLDHEVRLWNAKTAECIGSRDFYRPIASIAFHAQGECLAVASGHKLYMWHYNRRGEASSPAIILKTRRSLRAVHFHPHAAPFLLTAEVNELDSSDPSMSVATSPGYLQYPPPTIYLADGQSNCPSNSANEQPIISIPFLAWPPPNSIGDGALPRQMSDVDISSSALQQRVDTSASVRLLTYSTQSGQYELVLSPMESNEAVAPDEQLNISTREMGTNTTGQVEMRSNQLFPLGDPEHWKVPFLQGWLVGQSQANPHAMHSQIVGPNGGFLSYNVVRNSPGMVHSAISTNIGNTRMHRDAVVLNSIRPQNRSSQPFMSHVQSEVATSLAETAAAELPCTVKLRIWSLDVQNPCAALDKCRLTIPHAVLCSEMGAHFSPCGRFLAACVACILPNIESDPGFQGQIQHDNRGPSTSPTRHPISAHRVMYELRIYSLEEGSFGVVLASRAIRAAHCLTSIQFSPTSEHLLLAYGRRHVSLLKSVVYDGDTTVPSYTILEVYRVSDMELVRVLPSADDEVNVACFNPLAGGGLVYGTKEGKLRILQCDVSNDSITEGSCAPNVNIVQGPAYALEG